MTNAIPAKVLVGDRAAAGEDHGRERVGHCGAGRKIRGLAADRPSWAAPDRAGPRPASTRAAERLRRRERGGSGKEGEFEGDRTLISPFSMYQPHENVVSVR